MPPFVLFIVVIIAAIVIVTVTSDITTKRKRLEALKQNFGKPPAENDLFQFESIARYHQFMLNHNPSPQVVDTITWNDLDMDRIYKRINACQTSVGEEYLYHVLHDLPLNNNAFLQREKLINFFTKNPNIRTKVQANLAHYVGKENFNGLSSLLFTPSATALKWPHLYKAMALLPLAMILTMLLNLPSGVIGLVASFIANAIIHYRAKMRIAVELPSIKYLTGILRFSKQLGKISELCDLTTNIHRQYANLKRKVPTMTSPSGDSMSVIFEYFNIMLLIEVRNYNKVMGTIRKHNRELLELYGAIGEIDISIAVLSFRLSLPEYCLPEFHSNSSLVCEDIYHPLIENPVTNTATIVNDTLLTGSNASGKSTFIKALAINGILAQTINTCAASLFKTRYSLIMTSMVVRDDLAEGDSYFIVEIKSLKRVLDMVEKHPCTCYIDEILRGTNTIERIAASASVLTYLHNKDALCVAATHDIELTNILAGMYSNFHFCEQVTKDGISFDYKLKDGPSTSRNAIKLLGVMDFPVEIISQAEGLAHDIGGIE